MERSGTTAGIRWRLAPCLAELVMEADEIAPHRSTISDGSIGNPAHVREGKPSYDPATGKGYGGSDHNPDDHGYVCAVDLTHDPAGGFDAIAMFWTILGHLRAGTENRIAYVKVESVLPGYDLMGHDLTGVWRAWTADHVPSSNTGGHLHVSCVHIPPGRDDSRNWDLAGTPAPKPTPAPAHRRSTVFVALTDGTPHVGTHPGVALSDDGSSVIAYDCQPFDPHNAQVAEAFGFQVFKLKPAATRIGPSATKVGLDVLLGNKVGFVPLLPAWKCA